MANTMNDAFDNPDSVNDRLERLISRKLDGELTVEQSRELDGILARDPSARRLLDEHRRLDDLAKSALGAQFDLSNTAVRPVRAGGLRLAIAGAVLAAAAVVLLSFLPDLLRWSPTGADRRGGKGSGPNDVARVPDAPGVYPRNDFNAGVGRPQFVDFNPDYGHADYLPRVRNRDVMRDLIGVQTKDAKNQDVIYIFERNSLSTKIKPITGDF